MSIIHDALKKAEREREPVSPGLPFYRATKATGRRWKGSVATGLLVGAATLGAFSVWTWPRSQGVPSPAVVTAPIASMSGPGRAGDTDQHGAAREPTAVVRTLDAASRSQPDAVLSVPAPGAHQTAESAFAEAREAESHGQWEQAIRHYRRAIALDPTLLQARNNLGNLFIRLRQIGAAIEEFQAALSLDSAYALARNNLGSAYLLDGEEALAVREFLAAVHLDGAYVSPYYNLASLYARRGDVGQATAFLTRALAIEPAVGVWLQDDPDFDGIRGTPEFQSLRVRKQARR